MLRHFNMASLECEPKAVARADRRQTRLSWREPMISLRKALILTSTFCLTLAFAGTTLVSAVIEGGDANRGRELIKEKCKQCHIQGAEAGTMTPLSKTQQQWDRFVKKNRHDKIAPGTWGQIAEQDLKDILQYIYNHAADSEQPETCGF
jgi:mono/diheme cytochrome c family protein